ncbi:hypothetical protein LZ30DRAFT_686288 [Colletotrichum cereale]|nr:hypothetical protein LZ30DRAFT_686288 [Colletotrichum cereale]
MHRTDDLSISPKARVKRSAAPCLSNSSSTLGFLSRLSRAPRPVALREPHSLTKSLALPRRSETPSPLPRRCRSLSSGRPLNPSSPRPRPRSDCFAPELPLDFVFSLGAPHKSRQKDPSLGCPDRESAIRTRQRAPRALGRELSLGNIRAGKRWVGVAGSLDAFGPPRLLALFCSAPAEPAVWKVAGGRSLFVTR